MKTNSSQSGPQDAASESSTGDSTNQSSATSPRAITQTTWIAPTVLLICLGLLGGTLAAWKVNANQKNLAAAANQPEPMEVVTVAVAKEKAHRRTTTAIGTVVALRSISLRNELPGTIRETKLIPGQVVEAGDLLVALDVAVEEAELKAQEAEAALAKTLLARLERALQSRATSQVEVDPPVAPA